MTSRRLLAILFIVLATSAGWFALGTTVTDRTEESDGMLRSEVEKLWGGRHVQAAPTAWYEQKRQVQRDVTDTDAAGKATTRHVTEDVVDHIPVPLASSHIDATLGLDLRRKGLLWYDTYTIGFTSHYAIANESDVARSIHVAFAFPSRDAIYAGFRFEVGGRPAPVATDLAAGVTATIELAPHATAPVDVHYQSRGLDDWRYSLGEGVSQVRDFELVVHTDFDGIDYPTRTMSPNVRVREHDGWQLVWKFDSLVTGQQIGVDVPSRMNPGPLAARISFFAPVGLVFFVTVIVILGIVRGHSLHPMNYVFVSAGFFSFHLMLAYLADHVEIHAAFGIASAVSVSLVVSYLRLVVGRLFMIVEAAIAQLVFLVLFSCSFFFEGYTGLTLTVASVLTLFVLMRVTAEIDWNTALARPEPEPIAKPT